MDLDQALLQTFWDLAEGLEASRLKATCRLITILSEKQQKGEDQCKEVGYALTRLVRGVASNRKWARLGFVTALTQVLRHFPSITIADVIKKMGSELTVQKTDSKSEKSNVLLGKVMVYLALIRSDAMLKAKGPEIKKMVTTLLETCNKLPLHQISTQSLVELLSQVEKDKFDKQIWPLLEENLKSGWEKGSADTLLQLITLQKYQPHKVDKNFLKSHWGCKQLLAKNNHTHIAKVLQNSTCDHPIIHPVGAAVLEAAVSSGSQRFVVLWKTVFEDCLFNGGSNRKYLVLQLVPLALKLATATETVEAVLSPAFVDNIVKHMSSPKHPLHGATRQMLSTICRDIAPGMSGELQVAMVTALLRTSAGVRFDGLTHSPTVASMMKALNAEGAKLMTDYLMKTVREGKAQPEPTERQKEESEASEGDSDEDGSPPRSDDGHLRRKWAAERLSDLTVQVAIATDPGRQLAILQFLFVSAFFEVKKASKDLPQCDVVCKGLSPTTQQALQESFFRALNKLISHKPEKGTRNYRAPTGVMYQIVVFAQSLLDAKSASVSPLLPLTEEVAEAWAKMKSVVDKLEKTTSQEASEQRDSLAFELLFLHHGLQLLKTPAPAMEVLDELHACHSKAAQRRRRQSIKKADLEEPEWIDVLVELLISLLSQESHLVRVVVKSVFAMLCPHMRKETLQLILEAMQARPGAEGDGPLDVDEEDDPDEDQDSGLEEDSAADETLGMDATTVGPLADSDSDSEEDDEDGDPSDEFRAAVRGALGRAAAPPSDEEEEEEKAEDDLDDEAMFKMDAALAAVFRGRKKSKKSEAELERQIKDFRMRCLDLIEILIDNYPNAELMLDLIRPLLELMEMGVKDKQLRDLGERVTRVFHRLCAPRKLSPDPGLDRRAIPDAFQSLLEYSCKVSGIPMVREVASACLMLVRVMLDMESDTGPSPIKTRSRSVIQKEDKDSKPEDPDNLQRVHDIISNALKDFCEKRDSKMNHFFFLTLFERQPGLMWPLTDLLRNFLKRPDIRVFCRTQVCSMLGAMISKKTVQDIGSEVWASFAPEMVKDLHGILDRSKTQEIIKPKYQYEVMLVLRKIIITCDESLLKEIDAPQLLERVQEIRKTANTDVRAVSNKLAGLLTSRIASVQGKSKKKKDKKRKKSKPQPDDDTASPGGGDSASKSPAPVQTPSNGATPGETPSKKSKKQKKQRDSSPLPQPQGGAKGGLQTPSPVKKTLKNDTPRRVPGSGASPAVAAMNGTSLTPASGGSSKKKRKSMQEHTTEGGAGSDTKKLKTTPERSSDEGRPEAKTPKQTLNATTPIKAAKTPKTPKSSNGATPGETPSKKSRKQKKQRDSSPQTQPQGGAKGGLQTPSPVKKTLKNDTPRPVPGSGASPAVAAMNGTSLTPASGGSSKKKRKSMQEHTTEGGAGSDTKKMKTTPERSSDEGRPEAKTPKQTLNAKTPIKAAKTTKTPKSSKKTPLKTPKKQSTG